MNNFNLIKRNNVVDYILSMLVFCLPLTVFCLLVSWGIEVLAMELFRLS